MAFILQAMGRGDEAQAATDALLAEEESGDGWGDAFEPMLSLRCALAPLGDSRALCAAQAGGANPGPAAAGP
jgi:hypothetical protein